MTAAYALIIVLGLIVVFLLTLVVGLMRSHADVLRRLDSLGVRLDSGSETMHQVDLTPRKTQGVGQRLESTEISGVTPDGETVALSLSVGSRPTLIGFLSTTCSSCTLFWERFTSSTVELRSGTYRVVLVTLGPDEESPTRASNLSRGTADTVMSSAAWANFEVPGAPYFALVDKGTLLGEGTATTVEALEQFLEDASGDASWDRSRVSDRTDRDREEIVDRELKEAGIEPGDPRLYHAPGDLDG